MNVYAVLAKQANESLRMRLEQKYRGKYYYWTDSAYFLETPDAAMQVSDNLGVAIGTPREQWGMTTPPQHPEPLSGIVIVKLSSVYWGHTDTALWEWLKSSFEGGADA